MIALIIDQLLSLDERLSAQLSLRRPLLRTLATIIAHTGDALFWLLGAGAMFLAAESSLWRNLTMRIVLATGASGLVSTVLKWMFRRQRPPGPSAGLYFSLDQHALPSGHATRVACITVAIGPLLPFWWATPLLALWAALVSLSRVALQVHYLLDVLVGLAVGILVGLAVTQIG